MLKRQIKKNESQERSTKMNFTALNATNSSECEQALVAEYDRPMHVGAIFIMFVVSFLGALTPFLAHRFSSGAVADACHRIGMSFGTGIVLATAVIHMLPPAQEYLKHPCAAKYFSDPDYPWVELIGMTTILVVHGFEFIARCVAENRALAKLHKRSGTSRARCLPSPALKESAAAQPQDHVVAVVVAPSPHTAAAEGSGNNDDDEQPICEDDACSHGGANLEEILSGSAELTHKIGLMVLELGIAMHSVLIGLALGVSTGDEFRSLLVALCFHQYFEGAGLGATCIASGVKSRTSRALLVAWYSLSTPLGVAIGVGMYSTYDTNDGTSMLVQGIMDSVSFGILVYVALVELMTEHMTLSAKFRGSTVWMRLASFVSMYLGATAMAILGKYA
jgi:zinc transporter 1/2/3